MVDPTPTRPDADAAPTRPGRGPLLIGALVAALVLIAVLAVWLNRPPAPPAPSGGTPPGQVAGTTSTEGRPAPGTAAAAAQAYLEALARGDAAGALAAAAQPPADRTFLTDAALAAARRGAPITDVRVDPAQVASSSVRVQFVVGGQTREAHLPVTQVGGEFKVTTAAAKVSLRGLAHPRLGLQINGVPATAETVALFPGRYELSTSNGLYRLAQTTLDVQPGHAEEALDAAVELAPGRVAEFQALAKAELTRCLDEYTLNTDNCGLGSPVMIGAVREAGQVKMSCRLTAGQESLDQAPQVRLSSDLATATVFVGVQAACAYGDKSGVLPVFGYTVDLTKEPVTVTFASR